MKKSVDVQWVISNVLHPKEHFVECCRSKKGLTTLAEYEHILLAQSNNLVMQIVTMEQMSAPKSDKQYGEIFVTEIYMDEEEEINTIRPVRFMMNSKDEGNPEHDIGTTIKVTDERDVERLTSTHQQTLNEIYNTVGAKQLT